MFQILSHACATFAIRFADAVVLPNPARERFAVPRTRLLSVSCSRQAIISPPQVHGLFPRQLVLWRIRAAPSAHLGHLSFEGQGAFPPNVECRRRGL